MPVMKDSKEAGGGKMREIQVSQITDVIERLCIEANEHLPGDVKDAIQTCRACEDWDIAQGVLDQIIENYEIADQQNVPICQDTGMACVFLEIGQDVHIAGGDLTDAVNEGVRRGYDKGYLRKSVVGDPVRRGNTGDNTPAMIYTEIVPGDQLKIAVGPKGFGSENMSMIRMFKPSAGLQGIKDFILEVVETAGPNPCPPMVVGVGIGGTFDKAALLAKKALMRPIDTAHEDPYYAELEVEMLEKVNQLGIGPQGFGGRTTAIGLNIETLPTHIAGMPCAVNINCHVTRHKSEVI
jgi:fumarate hydratase subunit alpha